MANNNFQYLVATLWREVESLPADPDKGASNLWSALDELDRELGEYSPAENELAELAKTIDELRQTATRHDTVLPVLATALHTLIWPYRRNRQYEQILPLTEERVVIYRSLVATTPSQGNKVCYRESLDDLGRTFYMLHRNHQALTVIEEAVAMARDELAAGWAASEDLARHLSLMCSCLNALERHEDAVAAAEEVVRLETKVRLADPTADKAPIARALDDLGHCLNAAGRHSYAVTTMRESVALYRQLAADGRLDAQYNVADTLCRLGLYAEDAGQLADAIAAFREEVTLRSGLPIRDSRTDVVDLATALANLAVLLQRNGQIAEMMSVAEVAIVRYRALANAGQLDPPKTWGLNKTAALVREQLMACKQYSEALADSREQVEAYRQLAANRPDLHNVGLADALTDLAELLEVNGYRRKATKARAEAQAIRS